MEDYFKGAVGQLYERAQELLSQVPRGPAQLPSELLLLSQGCITKLNEVLKDLEYVLDDPLMQRADLQSSRLRTFRRSVQALDIIENVGVAALVRRDLKGDLWLNRLVSQITKEINYPLNPPVVTSLSKQYFSYNGFLDVLSVPLNEGNHLLHLPDLYHELAHPLLFPERFRDRRLQHLQYSFLTASKEVDQHFLKEKDERIRERGPTTLTQNLEQWRKNWGRFWIVEFFCDLYALYTVGPAYAWGHLHLVAKTGENVFENFDRHPADDARMRVLLNGLRLIGFEKAALEIKQRWDTLIALSPNGSNADYYYCYPESLLDLVTQKAYEGTVGIACNIVSLENQGAICQILNSAWDAFWSNPSEFASTEKSMIELLQKQFLSSNRYD